MGAATKLHPYFYTKRMKIVVACDSFKGCLTSREIAQTVAQALAGICPEAVVDQTIVADGGEGTVDALTAACESPIEWVSCHVDAPLPELPQVEACYAIDRDSNTAIMELAAASGLPLVPVNKRNIMRASTLGTGQMILDAIEHDCRKIIMGLGGSATCDGGLGLLAALGAEFFDTNGRYLYPCAESLAKIQEINLTGISDKVSSTHITLLTDVDNPLCGLQGAAHIFAPQKGASPEQVELLEQGMRKYSLFLGDTAHRPGAGAAGGTSAGMVALLPHCIMVKGAPFILGKARLSQRIKDADLVITGEGRIDGQTTMGKVPHAVAAIARQYDIPVLAICGSAAADVHSSQLGFKHIIPVTPTDMPLDIAIQKNMARENITRAITRYFTIGVI